MKILHVESSLNWGGQEQRTVSEVRWLRCHGHEAWIACNPQSELARRAPDLCVPVRLRRSFDPVATGALKAICLRQGVDLLHVHSPKDAWVCAALHLTVGPPVVRSRQITNPVKPSWSRSIVYRRGCAHVVATSRSIRENLISRNAVPPQRISTVGEGVDLEVFHPEVDGREFRRELGIADDEVLFGIVAMIRGEKGHVEFVRAARDVARVRSRARFVVVGEGVGDRAFEHDVRALAARILPSRALMFTGFRRDVPHVMAGLDVLVVPSLAEAQSLVVPQAFATRRAVIASNVGGLPELVVHEETGLIVEPGQVDALSAAMVRLCDDAVLRGRLAAAGHGFARANLSFCRKMEQTLAIYERVARGEAGRRARRSSSRSARRVGGLVMAAAMVMLMWIGSVASVDRRNLEEQAVAETRAARSASAVVSLDHFDEEEEMSADFSFLDPDEDDEESVG